MLRAGGSGGLRAGVTDHHARHRLPAFSHSLPVLNHSLPSLHTVNRETLSGNFLSPWSKIKGQRPGIHGWDSRCSLSKSHLLGLY